MRILLLNQAFHPDVAATAQYLSEVAEELARQGHQVTVVTSRRAYDSPETLFPRRETWKGVEIYRLGSTGFGKRAKWRRAADFASFMGAGCVRLARLPRQDVVVALTSPPLISVIGACFARLWRAKFFYWIMDFNPDEAIAAGWLRARSLAARLLERLSRFSLRSADKIIALDRFMRDRIVAKGIRTEQIEIIPPWSHDNQIRFDLDGRERFRKAHGLENKFVVMYSGNHSPCHPLDTLLSAAQNLNPNLNPAPLGGKGEGPTSDLRPVTSGLSSLIFLFIGGGSEFVRVQQFAADHHLSNILCLPYQPFNRLSASLSAADLQVVVMGDPFVGLIHPCKVYNLLSIGTPILYLGPPESHITELLAPEPSSNLCPPPSGFWSLRHGDVAGLADCLKILLNARRREQGAISRIQAPSSFSRESCLLRLLRLLTTR